MTTATSLHPLLAPPALAPERDVPASLLDELRELAGAIDQRSERSRQLFEQLRKMLGQERLTICLLGIQQLAERGEPAGARLVAALLDAQTPGAQLLPRVRRFRSAGRLLVVDPELVGAAFLESWRADLAAVEGACRERAGRAFAEPTEPVRPVDRPPLPLLRHVLDALLPDGATAAVTTADLALLGTLVRLECDAYQERVSRLAGTIDPFAVTAVMRLLPLLNRADTEIRDLDRLASWLEQGDLDAVFRRRVPREHDILDEGERPRLAATLAGDPRLAPLAAVHRAFVAAPTALRDISGPLARLLVLGRALCRRHLRADDLGLVSALAMVLENRSEGRFALPLPPELADMIGTILLSGREGDGDLGGLEITAGHLHVLEPRLGLGDRVWRHDLPTLGEMQGAADPEERDDAEDDEQDDTDNTSAFAVKQMVLNNVGSVSIVLGFLRNAKVTSIPGLVADVVRRTRSTRVLEVIAGDRNLYSGHANKEVPRALLESPVNISVKTLRRFIHVKYVSKTDLRRLARDRSRLRKEVCKEIEAYLDSLA